MLAGVAEATGSRARFVQAEGVIVGRVTPGRLRGALVRAVRDGEPVRA
jgi:hypothetical protein